MAMEDDAGIGSLVQGLFEEKGGLKVLLEKLVQAAMAQEVEAHVGAGVYQRGIQRRGWRNGVKPRSLKTRVGELALSVPQVRGCEPYHPTMFARYERSERALLVACAEMYFQGVSTRRVQEVLGALNGLELSAMTVSRVAQELDETLEGFGHRRLDGAAYRYLIVDARYEHVRVEGKVVSQALLVVAGVAQSGQREILSWLVGDSESESTWSEVFSDLKQRGLRGVELIVSDKHGGIVQAAKRHFQGVPWQRCRVHFLRDLMRKVSWRDVKELMAQVKAAFRPEERVECLRLAEEVALRWERRAPKVAALLREGFEECLAVVGLPSAHRRRLNTTNLLERLMRELKRRTRTVGVFPNRASLGRLAGAVLLATHENWQLERNVYLSMENL
jgi:transposase-like protein